MTETTRDIILKSYHLLFHEIKNVEFDCKTIEQQLIQTTDMLNIKKHKLIELIKDLEEHGMKVYEDGNVVKDEL